MFSRPNQMLYSVVIALANLYGAKKVNGKK